MTDSPGAVSARQHVAGLAERSADVTCGRGSGQSLHRGGDALVGRRQGDEWDPTFTAIVETLASRWWVESTRSRTTVHAVIDLA